MTTSSQPKRLGFSPAFLTKAVRRSALPSRHRADRPCGEAWLRLGLGRSAPFPRSGGGLPSPLVFLAQVAARTSRIRLGTGIIPCRSSTRSASRRTRLSSTCCREGASKLASERAELHPHSLRSGWTARTARHLRPVPGHRSKCMGRQFARRRRHALSLGAPSERPRLAGDLSTWGGARAGRAGTASCSSRTQPRPKEAPQATLAEIQHPIIDAYLEALPVGTEPRIVASRSVFVADDREEALRLAEKGCGAS